MEKLKNLSIRKAILLYLVVGLFFSFLAWALLFRGAEGLQRSIWEKYVDEERYWEAVQGEHGDYQAAIPRPGSADMTRLDRIISELCDFIQTYGLLALTAISMLVAVTCFYRDKIEVPLRELTAASEKIGENRLDFQITYQNRDELGTLCIEFEKMRSELEKNNRNMWKMVEQEKALRAAMAHDIRSPLATLKGYQEMLLEFIPEEELNQEELLKMLREGMHQIDRMEHFVETMRKLQSLEEREVCRRGIFLRELREELFKNLEMLGRQAGKKISVSCKDAEWMAFVDAGMVCEAVDNLVENALRYARETVWVELKRMESALVITIRDDGAGFGGSSVSSHGAGFGGSSVSGHGVGFGGSTVSGHGAGFGSGTVSGHVSPRDELRHFGLGIYISRLYCEKHGGHLLTGNGEDGGALVEAVFF